MEVTKWLKPSCTRVTKYGDRASVRAVTRVNAEQASKRTMRRPTRRSYRGRLGMFVPAKTSAETVSRLHTDTSRALKSKEVIERLQVLGAEGAALSQQKFAVLTKAEARSVAEMIKRVGIRVEGATPTTIPH